MKSGQSHTNPISDSTSDEYVVGLRRVSSAPLLKRLLIPAGSDSKHVAGKPSKTPPASPNLDNSVLKQIEEAKQVNIKKPIPHKPVADLGKLNAEAIVSDTEQSASSPEAVKINKMAEELMKDPIVAVQGKDSIVRTLWHVLKESTDALYWVSKKNVENPLNVVHYKSSLFETMRSFALKSGKIAELFSPTQMIQVHDTTTLGITENSSKVKARRFVSNKKESKKNLEEIDLEKAAVYIPICVGYKEELTSANLENIISTYLQLKVEKVHVYLGRDAEKNVPADQLSEYSLKRKNDWLAKHSKSKCPSLFDSRVLVMTREDLENEKTFKNAQTVANAWFLEDADIEKTISNDTKNYFKRKLSQQHAQQLASEILPKPLSMKHGTKVVIPVSVEVVDNLVAANPHQSVAKKSLFKSTNPSPVSVSSLSAISSPDSQVSTQSTLSVPNLEIGAPAEVTVQSESVPNDKAKIQGQHPGVDNLTAYIVKEALDRTFKSSDPGSVQKCKEILSWLRSSSPPHNGNSQPSKVEPQLAVNRPR